MIPLRVEAQLAGSFMMAPSGTLHLDALLMSTVARRTGLAPVGEDNPPEPIPIPIERSPAGIYLSSDAIYQAAEYDVRYTRRRYPIKELILHGGEKKPLINPALGATKSKNQPCESIHPERSMVRWYCVGDRDGILGLLADVTHLGRMRGHGQGEVLRWSVEGCEVWDGFPLVYQGRPLRALPEDWPGLRSGCARDYRVLTPPYWWNRTEREVLCAVPGEGEPRPAC